MRGLQALAVSALARVEVPAAIWRKHRLGELDAPSARTLTQAFEADWHGSAEAGPRFAAVAASPRVLDDAAARAASHALRAYDAVQLASAVAAREADPGCILFACFDEALRSAAAADGFTLLP